MKFMLSETIFYPFAVIVAGLLIAVSMVWPQGQGVPSPAPFGHAIEVPDYFRMVKERDTRHARQAADKAARQTAAAASSAATSAVADSGLADSASAPAAPASAP